MKNYILDTNVLLHDPNSLLAFKTNTVLIPIEVLEELDRFKRESSELGQNARNVSRTLDGLRAKGHLNEGVKLENGGTLRIIFHDKNGNGHGPFGADTVDSRIVGHAMAVQQAEPKVPAILVTKDINLRIKADTVGLPAEDYETDRVLLTELYTGMVEMTVSAEKMSQFRLDGELELNGNKKYFPNEYCTLVEETNSKRTALTKVDPTGTKLIPILDVREGIWGIKPRNREQHFAFDALLDDKVKLVTLMGKAGTGKTVMAMAAASLKPPDRCMTGNSGVSSSRARQFRWAANSASYPARSKKSSTRGCSPFTTPSSCQTRSLNMGSDHRRSGPVLMLHSAFHHRRRGAPAWHSRSQASPHQFMVIDEASKI